MPGPFRLYDCLDFWFDKGMLCTAKKGLSLAVHNTPLSVTQKAFWVLIFF